MTKQMTCIVCPIGCRMSIEMEDGVILNITGNTCKKGYAYAQEELTAPKRVLTSTVFASIGGKSAYVPVKTEKPIPKELLFKAMEGINCFTLSKSVKLGDTVIEDIAGTGVKLLATNDF